MKKLVNSENFFILGLVAVASLIRYFMNLTCRWDAHFYLLYLPTSELIQLGRFPLHFEQMGSLYIPYGPALVYMYAPFLLIFRGLQSLIYFSILLEGISIYLFYRIGRDFYSRAVGMTAAILYAFSCFVISSAGNFSNGYFSSPFFLLFVYALFQVKFADRPRYLVIFFISSAILLQIHLSAYIIIPLLSIVAMERTEKGTRYKRTGLLLFLLFFSPLCLYFLLNGFDILEQVSSAIVRLFSGGGYGEITVWGQMRSLWVRYQQVILFSSPFIEKTDHSINLFSATLSISRDEWFMLGLNILCIFLSMLFALKMFFRDVRREKRVLWNKEIIWASLLLCALALLLATPLLLDYHFTLINIITIAMVSTIFGRIWGAAKPAGEEAGRGIPSTALRRGAVFILIILVCAVNLNAARERVRWQGMNSMFSFGFQKKVEQRLIRMSREPGDRGGDSGTIEGETRISLLESNIFYFKDRQLHLNWRITCLNAMLKEYLEADPRRQILSARNEYFLVSSDRGDAPPIRHSGRFESRDLVIQRYHSRIDHELCKVGFAFEPGWESPDFDDRHWLSRPLPFRIPEKGSMFGPCLDDIRSDDHYKEILESWRGKSGDIEGTVAWEELPAMPEVYLRFSLRREDPSAKSTLYIIYVKASENVRSPRKIEDLELFINGRKIGHSSITVLDSEQMIIDPLGRFLDRDENLIALQVKEYNWMDLLIVFELLHQEQADPD